MPTYMIVRFYQDRPGDPDVIRRGLTLDEAQEHCNDLATSSCEGEYGPWFDGYREE